ncbi:hypothetical protein [Citrobacter sp. wls620]|uniref:hypothetical protein n=1 Tax=Citrobacter sp. wls620 TaxID=2576431 RepID=UPI001484F889|nr:hypothetical protein [Citrobacter sp. wls620]
MAERTKRKPSKAVRKAFMKAKGKAWLKEKKRQYASKQDWFEEKEAQMAQVIEANKYI